MVLPKELAELSVEEKLDLAQALWDSIEEQAIQTPEWQAKIVAERYADYLTNPTTGIDWETLVRSLRK